MQPTAIRSRSPVFVPAQVSDVRQVTRVSHLRAPCAAPATAHLFLKHFFDLAKFLLNLSGEFLILPFGFQGRVVRQLSDFLLHPTFDLVKRAFDLIVRALCHISPCQYRSARALPLVPLSSRAVSGYAVAPSRNEKENGMLLLIILLILLFGGGGGYYGHSRWGYRGGAGVGLGTVLIILLLVYLLGIIH
jgi:hypothetical protein